MPRQLMFQSLGKVINPIELLHCLHSQKFRVRIKTLLLPNITRAAELGYIDHFCLISESKLLTSVLCVTYTIPGPGDTVVTKTYIYTRLPNQKDTY